MMRVCTWVFFAFLPVMAQPGNVLPFDDLVEQWKVSKQFTLDVAAAMPAEFYDFKPVAEEMSFGQLMFHIAGSQVFRFQQLTGIKPGPKFLQAPPKAMSKEFILSMLADSFDYVIGVLPKITPEQLDKRLKVDWKGRPEATGRQMMMNMFVHAAHHRAQAEVYLRIKGITPPVYTF